MERTELNTLGEFGLIDRIKSKFTTKNAETIKGIGDDAAVIDVDHPAVGDEARAEALPQRGIQVSRARKLELRRGSHAGQGAQRQEHHDGAPPDHPRLTHRVRCVRDGRAAAHGR